MNRAPKRRTFWEYCKSNWEGLLALAFIIPIGIVAWNSKQNGGLVILVLMAIALFVLVFKSIQDWKRNG